MSFYSGKKVLVTGSEGFIGSHLTEALAKEGAKVRAFCLYNSFSSWGWLESLPAELMAQVEVFPGDIRDPKRVEEVCGGNGDHIPFVQPHRHSLQLPRAGQLCADQRGRRGECAERLPQAMA